MAYSRNYVSACDQAYEKEIFFTTRRGTRFLNLSGFKDANRYDLWDYSAFVRKYALYLDERLDYRMQRRGKHGGDDDYGEEDDHRETNTKTRSRALLVKSKPVTEMKTKENLHQSTTFATAS
ncbi:AP180 N-terminal homology (ANTH) domain-containing protein [Hirschfeldia incana]|nr:AP180 N-terminal homology (ANTH) domain-containing protein [Hirschfeldia incana]